MVSDALQGYNSTIMAYGQTGSGKTYTMFGELSDPSRMGIIPRVSRDIFRSIQEMLEFEEEAEYQIKIQMLEIYKEKFIDLLVD